MKQLNSNKLIYIILLLGFIAGVVAILTTNISYGGGDSTQHYNLARWGLIHPKLLFNHWGKPVLTILMSPFAQFGINGARAYNLFMGFATAFTIWKIAEYLKFKNASLSLIFVLFTPVYFILLFTPLTEITYSFFVSLSVLLFFKKKYYFSAIVFSFTPLIRTEGIVLFPLFILAYSLKKKFFTIPLLSVGFFLISLLGYSFYDDFWWLITEMPYSGSAKDIYGSGSLFHFINDTKGILGYPLGFLFLFGLICSIRDWYNKAKLSISKIFFFILLIPGSYIVFLAAHSFVWWQGMGNSLGLVRVIGSVTPLAALTALFGFNRAADFVSLKNKFLAIFLKFGFIILIIILGITTHKRGLKLSRPQQLVKQAANYAIDNNLNKHKVYFFDPFAVFALDMDPYDNKICNWGLPNKEIPSIGIPDSSIIFWDAHFGSNEGRIYLENLKNDKELSILKVIRPTQPFKVLGGYDYAVYIFQKIPKKAINKESTNTNLVKDIYLDFENLPDGNTTNRTYWLS